MIDSLKGYKRKAIGKMKFLYIFKLTFECLSKYLIIMFFSPIFYSQEARDQR